MITIVLHTRVINWVGLCGLLCPKNGKVLVSAAMEPMQPEMIQKAIDFLKIDIQEVEYACFKELLEMPPMIFGELGRSKDEVRRILLRYMGLSSEVKVEIEMVVFNLLSYTRQGDKKLLDPFHRLSRMPAMRFFPFPVEPKTPQEAKTRRESALAELSSFNAIELKTAKKFQEPDLKKLGGYSALFLGFDLMVAAALMAAVQSKVARRIELVDGRIVEFAGLQQLAVIGNPVEGSWSQKFLSYLWQHQGKDLSYKKIRKDIEYEEKTPFRPSQWIRELGFVTKELRDRYFLPREGNIIHFRTQTNEPLTKLEQS